MGYFAYNRVENANVLIFLQNLLTNFLQNIQKRPRIRHLMHYLENLDDCFKKFSKEFLQIQQKSILWSFETFQECKSCIIQKQALIGQNLWSLEHQISQCFSAKFGSILFRFRAKYDVISLARVRIRVASFVPGWGWSSVSVKFFGDKVPKTIENRVIQGLYVEFL